MFENQPKANKN